MLHTIKRIAKSSCPKKKWEKEDTICDQLSIVTFCKKKNTENQYTIDALW